MDPCDFSLSHYRACLEEARRRGYTFYSMMEAAAMGDGCSAKAIVLRHDLDHRVTLASKFAEIECAVGVTATYFVRIHAPYNAASVENFRVLRALQRMNHEIGLHFDCDFASLFDEEPEALLRRDKAVLESILGTSIRGVSPHEPLKSLFAITDECAREIGFAYHAYSDLFTKRMKYVSDSSSRWREGCMCQFITADTPRLCILTHPIWWFHESPLENY
jgi:hypothetical protein